MESTTPLGLQLQQITETRSANKCEHISKMGVEISPRSLKFAPRSSTKTMLENVPHEINKNSKYDSKFIPPKRLYFGGGASWGTFVGPTHFWTLKMGPYRSQSVPIDQKMTQTRHQEPHDSEKELQKTSLFKTCPGGLREALTITIT